MTKQELQRMIGQNIRYAREQRHLTRDELSERVGLTPNFISQVEGGHKSLSIESLCAIATELNTSADSILFGFDRRSSAEADIAVLLSGMNDEDCKKLNTIIRVIAEQFTPVEPQPSGASVSEVPGLEDRRSC